jgi:hypothetical protein
MFLTDCIDIRGFRERLVSLTDYTDNHRYKWIIMECFYDYECSLFTSFELT